MITFRVTPVVVLIAITSLLYSCKSSKTISQVTKRSADEVISGLHEQYTDYSFFSAKARMKFNGEESRVGGRMNILAKRDSLIWMNFKKFSIEGARTLIQPDTMWIVYRLDDIYEQGPTDEYLDYYKVNLSFQELQDLLVGNVPIPKTEELMTYQSTEHYQLSFEYNERIYKYLINENLTLHKASIKDQYERTVVIHFNDYDAKLFAKRKDIEIITPEEGVSKISIKFSSVTFDVPKAIKFDIPTHYRRLP